MSGGGKKKSKKSSKKGSKKSSKKGSKKSSKKGSKKMSGGGKKKSKKSSKKGSKKQRGGRDMNPSMKAFLELKTKIAKELGIPNGIAPAKIAGEINSKLKEKIPDAIERAKEAFKIFMEDPEKYRKMA